VALTSRQRNKLPDRAAQPQTSGTYPTIARKVRTRMGSKIPTVSKSKGTVSRPGLRRGGRRR
jgi:hypothetical protein